MKASSQIGRSLAEWQDWQETGRKRDPDQVRAVGVRLAASLPAIIAAAADRSKRVAAARRAAR